MFTPVCTIIIADDQTISGVIKCYVI